MAALRPSPLPLRRAGDGGPRAGAAPVRAPPLPPLARGGGAPTVAPSVAVAVVMHVQVHVQRRGGQRLRRGAAAGLTLELRAGVGRSQRGPPAALARGPQLPLARGDARAGAAARALRRDRNRARSGRRRVVRRAAGGGRARGRPRVLHHAVVRRQREGRGRKAPADHPSAAEPCESRDCAETARRVPGR